MATIAEYYVSFEIAKLLKEKGFNEPCLKEYYINGNLSDISIEARYNTINNQVSAPTLQMAIKWLEIKKHIAIIPILISILDNKKFLWDIKIVIAKTGENYSQRWVYEDRERACEAAIKYSLENLI